MDAPSLGAIADDVLIAVVERIGDAQVELDRVGDAIGDARAGQPIGRQPDALGGEDVEIGVDAARRCRRPPRRSSAGRALPSSATLPLCLGRRCSLSCVPPGPRGSLASRKA